MFTDVTSAFVLGGTTGQGQPGECKQALFVSLVGKITLNTLNCKQSNVSKVKDTTLTKRSLTDM